MAAHDASKRVEIDWNHAPFQRQVWALDAPQLKILQRAMRRVSAMTWQQIYDDHGLNWERIANSDHRYSIRLNQQARAVVTRQGDFMRFESLHYDHDSAYDQ